MRKIKIGNDKGNRINRVSLEVCSGPFGFAQGRALGRFAPPVYLEATTDFPDKWSWKARSFRKTDFSGNA